jgi:hypothetical protein
MFGFASVLFLAPLMAAERPPKLYHSAPVITWAKPAGKHRFRSPRNYEDTLLYYRKILKGAWKVSWKKIINSAAIRAQHIKNNKRSSSWEGLNIYEHKGATYIFVVLSDNVLKKAS